MTLVKVPSTQVVSHSLRALVEQGLDMPAGWKCLPAQIIVYKNTCPLALQQLYVTNTSQ